MAACLRPATRRSNGGTCDYEYSHIDVQAGGTFQATNTLFNIDAILLDTASAAQIQLSQVNAPVTVNPGVNFQFTVANHESLSVIGSLQVTGSNTLSVSADSSLSVTGNLTAGQAPALRLNGEITFNGSGNSGTPQLLEAMCRDVGPDGDFNSSFALGSLTLGNDTYVKLVDQSDNSAGGGPEAVYTNSVVVPQNTTLDLNGLHLYARGVQIAGSAINGTIEQPPVVALHLLQRLVV